MATCRDSLVLAGSWFDIFSFFASGAVLWRSRAANESAARKAADEATEESTSTPGGFKKGAQRGAKLRPGVIRMGLGVQKWSFWDRKSRNCSRVFPGLDESFGSGSGRDQGGPRGPRGHIFRQFCASRGPRGPRAPLWGAPLFPFVAHGSTGNSVVPSRTDPWFCTPRSRMT